MNKVLTAIRKPRALVDADGVLFDFCAGALKVVAMITGRTYTRQQVTEFDLCKALGLSEQETGRVMQHIGNTPGFCDSLPLYMEALDGMDRLHAVAEVHIVTSPWPSSPTWAHERTMALRRAFGVHRDNVHPSSGKHVFAGDMFVDDRAPNVAAWIEEHPNKVAVLWRTPHNQTEQLPYGARETSSWKDLERWAINLVRPRKTEIEL
jgi:5'(3')-deoxyribonucleotidase